MKLSSVLILSAMAATDASRGIEARGRPEKDNQTGIHRELKGKGGKGNTYERAIDEYEDPPAGLLPGDVITGCDVKLKDDLDCRGGFECLTLDATIGNVELDCGGHTIGGYDDMHIGIEVQGCNDNTITIKNCFVTGFDTCIETRSNDDDCDDINIVIENSAAVGCEDYGILADNNGDATFIEVAATGNGQDGILVESSVENVVLDRVFACGNARDDANVDIDFNGTPTSLVTMDVTAGLLEGASFDIIPCPLYEDPACVAVNGEDDSDDS